MHFEILVEDASGKIFLEAIMTKILDYETQPHTYKIIAYKGIGRIPSDLKGKADPQRRMLLNNLPRILRGYGKSLQSSECAVIVVVDLDRKNCLDFKMELLDLLSGCDPKPKTFFRIAIEECEAWLLGDLNAVREAYPSAKTTVLNNYNQDSICDTWEKLADAVYPGGSRKLKTYGWPQTGITKCEWAKNISQYLDIDNNLSKSFQVFRDCIRNLAGINPS